jgi:ABC-type branched-subunit amino acid transport system ATPase component
MVPRREHSPSAVASLRARTGEPVSGVQSPVATAGGHEMTVSTMVKTFGGNRAVDGVSFTLDRGGILGLIGPNGAGKSTLGNLICGSLRADRGEIVLRGLRIEALPPHERSRLGLARTFQMSSEFQRLSVMENLLVGSELRDQAAWWRSIAARRRWREIEMREVTRARELLADFELSQWETTPAGALSGGQRRLVEIARALMGKPTVLILDEPMAGLSPHMVEMVSSHLVRLREGNFAILLVEHNVGVVSRLSDRVIAMSQGRVIAEGSAEDVLGDDEVQAVYVAG